MARKTLLFASSGCSTICGGGKSGKLLAVECFCFLEGTGDCLRRAEGLIVILCRIRVP